MKKITLEEKIKIITAYHNKEVVERLYEYDGIEVWRPVGVDAWNFDQDQYRIKPISEPKFKIGDKLVDKRSEGIENPMRLKLTSITDGVALLDDCWDVSIKELHKYYTYVDDVLWYFETYDASAQTWKMITDRRFSLSEASDRFKYEYEHDTLRPLYALGFALSKKRGE
jgi:hypothetical protein